MTDAIGGSTRPGAVRWHVLVARFLAYAFDAMGFISPHPLPAPRLEGLPS